MQKIKILTDSASDISTENEIALDIKIMNFKITVGDNSYISREDFDNNKFYEIMDSYDGIPTTSQITVFDYEEIFKEFYEAGFTDVINVTINSNGSATYNNAVMAAKQFMESNPDAFGKFRIYNIDSKNYTGGYGYPVVQAAVKASKGDSAEEIVAYLNDWFEKLIIYFAPYSLKYAKKSGRIPSAAAFVGEVLGLKPIMRICDGEIVTNDKVRGDKAVIPALIDKTLSEMIPQTPYCIIYGSDSDIKDELYSAITKRIGYPPEDIYQIGAAIAINAGPKVAGIILKSKREI